MLYDFLAFEPDKAAVDAEKLGDAFLTDCALQD